MAEWKGYIEIPEQIVDNIVSISKLNSDSTEEEWMEWLDVVCEYDHYISNDAEGQQKYLFPSRRWTFLHHAAYHQAPLQIIKALKEKGYRLSLKDAEGKLPVDHANDESCKSVLQPKYSVNVDMEKLNKIEKNFHAVITSRADELVKKHNLILPVISVLLEGEKNVTKENVYFAVPGMYGGFSFWLKFTSDKADVESLITESWCRVAGGSGQRHVCTENNWSLEAEGFV